jgi:2-amino-1-hydroxyethylphosphonate dioxygenase (glycine-forming)
MTRSYLSIEDILDYLKYLFLRKGDALYGEHVTQSAHALQAAEYARRAGADEEMIIAAFLHDIGHLDGGTKQTPMNGFGVRYHEHLGADLLRGMGFSPRIATLVEGHVSAKRYLTGRNPSYLASLSEASRQTLDFQGGPMTPEECDLFASHPLFEQCLQMRHWDDLAKEPGWDTPIPDWIWSMISRHLAQRAEQG